MDRRVRPMSMSAIFKKFMSVSDVRVHRSLPLRKNDFTESTTEEDENES